MTTSSEPRSLSGSHSLPGLLIARPLAAGAALGDYVIGAPLWPLRIADAYRAEGPKGPATLYVVHAVVAQDAALRDAVIAGTRAAAALPEHKHVVHTIAAGLTGDTLWIATEEVDGSLVRDMLMKKRQATQAGLGARASGNLIAGVCSALADLPMCHGALGSESLTVNRAGRVRIVDLALAAGTVAAIARGVVPPHGSCAPEVAAGQAPTGASDVYGVGALLYEALVGKPLERGGPRPSEIVSGMSSQIDEVVARACHRDPDKRFGRTDVLGEVVSEALGQGGAMHTQSVPLLDAAPTLDQQVSLASELANPPAASPGASGSGNPVIDRALSSALADSTEKWLITKGKLDYGPFSLSDVVAQIDKGEVVAGNVIVDKDTGARSNVDAHPLLGPMVEAARQRIDDKRRAHAEIIHQGREKKRGVVLYGTIGAGVLAAVAAVYLVIHYASGDKESDKLKGVAALDNASLQVKISEPKAPPKRPHTGGAGGHHAGGTAGGTAANTGENLALDMSDDGDDASETLPMGEVYQVYSGAGGRLGSCLASNGGGSANISIIIDGPSGHVTWVKVNGQQAGGLYSCLSGVMRGLKFRSIHGPRTRAEFDIGV